MLDQLARCGSHAPLAMASFSTEGFTFRNTPESFFFLTGSSSSLCLHSDFWATCRLGENYLSGGSF
jgi:hypothetical protein